MTTRTAKKPASKRAAKTPAKGKAQTLPAATAPAAAKAEPRPRDPRLPKAGAVLTRTFQGKEIKVEVLDAGFRFDGKVWRSLSTIAKAVSGTSWNGFLFFGIQKRPAKPAKTEKAAPAPKAEAK
jgi:hypothetical protein